MDISTLENERRRAIQQQGDLRMGVSGGWNIANMRSSPYADFEPYDEEDEWGFGVEEDGQGFFYPIPRIPFDERAQNPETNDMMMIATHDKPLFRTPPATGAGADTMAPDWLIDYMNRKDENLFQVQDRLRRA